jgi:D-sedoheptulose 7-phosphate isomerase
MMYADQYLDETRRILSVLDVQVIETMVTLLATMRGRGGRLFLIGVGGSAANASHAVNDFRKIARLEAYTPTDNVAEITARTNDDGWDSVFRAYLSTSRMCHDDMLFVLSVGGGNAVVSANILPALNYARQVGSNILAIVGRDGGDAGRIANVCLKIPAVNADTVTPHTEEFQSVILHLLVTHPRLRLQP